MTSRSSKKRPAAEMQQQDELQETQLTSPFKQVKVSWQIHLPPLFASNVMDGIQSYLNQFLIKYMPELDGVLLSYKHITLLNTSAKIINDNPYLIIPISVILTLFAPQLRSNLVGIVNKTSPDHIGLLVFGTFNASIPADAIRRDEYIWNEDEWCWLHVKRMEAVGVGSVMRFTVADLVKRNSMLSISGSLRLSPQTTGLIPSTSLSSQPPLPATHDDYEDEQGAPPSPAPKRVHVKPERTISNNNNNNSQLSSSDDLVNLKTEEYEEVVEQVLEEEEQQDIPEEKLLVRKRKNKSVEQGMDERSMQQQQQVVAAVVEESAVVKTIVKTEKVIKKMQSKNKEQPQVEPAVVTKIEEPKEPKKSKKGKKVKQES
ncbi:hypothetical protein SmJEL517_g04452 [Synchytrium microbalum]|uniref:RPA43 OB domain-containing protein n=1 Tax=Synchytrium microbalum TaxID=1806994 RepID=A0A507C070_9FUNG|nr:uncharacterized protein SmJEL517_g04452 [Synchytrium microbalum]TPX32449.1 hypothetical protein SmJEL517_g04452 [Synchytrium microbalum]